MSQAAVNIFAMILLGGFAGMMTAFFMYCRKHMDKPPKKKKPKNKKHGTPDLHIQ